jgi:hypothetical protein
VSSGNLSEQSVVLSLEGGPAHFRRLLDKNPDLSPVGVRDSDSVLPELMGECFHQSVLTSPACDDSLLPSFDDLSSGLLPGLGGISHVFAIVIPHNFLFDVVGNSHYNVSMNTAETILFEQFIDVSVKVIVVGASSFVSHVVEDVVENSLSVSSVILDHVVDSHHDRSLVVQSDVQLAQATSGLTPVALLSDDHGSPAVVISDTGVLSDVLDDPSLNNLHDLDDVRSEVSAVTLGEDLLQVSLEAVLRDAVAVVDVVVQLSDEFIGVSVSVLRDDAPDITGQ